MCQVSLRLKGVQMGTQDFKYNNVPLCFWSKNQVPISILRKFAGGSVFARKPGNINTSMFAAPKLALVPASRYYCDVTCSYHNVCAKFH